MEISEFVAFALLEVLFVGALYAAYLHFRSRQKQTVVDDDTETETETETVPSDAYVTFLQDAILLADARLAGLADGEGAAQDQQKLIEMRLAFLSAERKAVDEAGTDEEKLWDLLSEQLAPLLPQEIEAGEHDSALVESLRVQIMTCEKRMANLEKFRSLFFEMKMQLSNNNARSEKLQSEVCRVVPVEDQSPELKKLMAELERDNREMSAQLESVEDAFTDILGKTSELMEAENDSIAGTMSDIDKDVERIRSVIALQENRISELAALIAEKEMALADKEKIAQAMEELSEAHKELQTVIEVFEEENQFLQEQISMLLKQELAKTEADEKELGDLRAQNAEHQAARVELSEKLASMEQEYLQMYEENRALKEGKN